MEAKPYRYRNLRFKSSPDTMLSLKVEYISDGNQGTTTITRPGHPQKLITNAGSADIGLASEVSGKQFVVFSSLSNAVPEELDIKLNFYINDQLVKAHSNPKTEADRINVICFITVDLL